MQDLPAGSALALRTAFEELREAHAKACFPDAEVRIDRLRRLESMLRAEGDRLARAVSADFGNRSRDETRLLELFPSLEAARHARKCVRVWMRSRRMPTSRWFLPGRSMVMPQPLGVVGIIVPWNYPILLAVSPLVAALAAGNRALIKMSELVPATSAAFAEMIARTFAADEVSVINGDSAIAQAFSALPFDHLLFTGSTGVGRAVMGAAAANLTPVTLELGGKSPAIVAPDYPIAHAAERIAVGKCMNAGQTCIAPDYVLVPNAMREAFTAELAKVVARLYPDAMHSPDYSTIVNARHFARLAGYLDDARTRGARIVPLGAHQPSPEAASRRFPPVAVIDAPADCALMREEIFGPILPIVGYDSLDAAIAYVNARPRPLALYYFDRQQARIDRMLHETIAGGVTVNDTILHIAQEELPFGGVGPSGMGHYHGRVGFDTFSKCKGVFRQSRWNAMSLFNPPYGKRFDRLVKLLVGR